MGRSLAFQVHVKVDFLMVNVGEIHQFHGFPMRKKKKLPQKTNGQLDRQKTQQQVWVLVSGQFAVSADQEERTKV